MISLRAKGTYNPRHIRGTITSVEPIYVVCNIISVLLSQSIPNNVSKSEAADLRLAVA